MMSLADDLKAYQSMMIDARSGEHINARFNRFRKVARSRYQQLESDDADWLLEQLHLDDRDRDTDAFVAVVLGSIERLSDRFFEPLLHAGIRERDPSKNRYLIEPAVRLFGFLRVATRLLESLSEGTNSEKSGSVNAFYWARVAARDDPEPYLALRQQIRDAFLVEFVNNSDTQVRRCILASLSMESSAYSPEIRGLLSTAIKIAREHDDEYIRHRIEVQLGNETLLLPLPDRTD